jgi:hypothetical protein
MPLKNVIPQDLAPWASKLLALKRAVPFQGSWSMANSRPEYVEVTGDGTCADVEVPEGSPHVLALEWVTGIEIGGEVSAPPRYAAKLRALRSHGPKGPLLVSIRAGRRFSVAEPAGRPDVRSVAVCDQDRGLETCDVTNLNPEPYRPIPSVQTARRPAGA